MFFFRYGKIYCRQTNVEVKFVKEIEQNLLQQEDFMKIQSKNRYFKEKLLKMSH
jgi:hypothetical protein